METTLKGKKTIGKESKQQPKQKIQVSSEIGKLERILIHSPDGGIGKVIPNKAQVWLYDDIVHLDKMRIEYDYYVKILLYFLDPDKITYIKEQQEKSKGNKKKRDVFKPDKPNYFNSDKVIDVESALAKILENKQVKIRLVASVFGIEKCSHLDQEYLLKLSAIDLAKTLITGVIPKEKRYVLPPIPNLIFTRDIGIVINDHLLLTRPAKQARYRESLIMKYITYYYFFEGKNWDKVIEINKDSDAFLLPDNEKELVSIEGGDVMMIAPKHLMVGYSERTSPMAINKLINTLFSKALVDKITVIKIPHKRSYMHIDTLFTMVKRNVWILYGPLAKQGKQIEQIAVDYVNSLKEDFQKKEEEQEQIVIKQFDRFQPNYIPQYSYENPKPVYLEDLFTQICRQDFGCQATMRFVYSGGGEFPHDEREQWTDSCNVLTLKEGVVIGYDRNTATSKAFAKQLGFTVIKAKDLIAKFEAGKLTPDDVTNTLILLPSAELSRARGGSHCMSMPLLRTAVV